MGWRDKFNILAFGTFDARPEPSSDLTEMVYIVVAGETNLGKPYRCTGTGWELIPLNEWLALVGHNHDEDYAPTPHGNEHHTEEYITSYEDDDTDRASATGAAHSQKAKTAALADNSSLLESFTAKQIMLMGGLIFGQ